MADFSDLGSALMTPNTPNFINPAYSTPEQRAELYAYGNSLLSPQPINNGWQGLASIARALIGGYEARNANLASQAARTNMQAEATPTGGAPTAAATPVPLAPVSAPVAGNIVPSSSEPDPATVSAYVTQAAAKRNIDPKTAVAMFTDESGLNPSAKGDGNSSFGVAQLHYGGVSKEAPNKGLGDAFTTATGMNARDPSTWQNQIDFALDSAKAQGWQPWANTRDKLGIGNYTGIGSHAALGQASPVGVPPALPPTPAYNQGQLGAMIADPNLPPDIRHMAMALTQPHMATDALGNVSPIYQGQATGAPVFRGGVLREQGTGSLPSVLSGSPGAPQNAMALPTVAGTAAGMPPLAVGGPGAPAPANTAQAVVSALGPLRNAQAEMEAKAGAIQGAGTVSGQQYTDDLKAAANFPRTSLPLMKAIPLLEQLGKTGTGPGTDTWNHAMSFLQSWGVPIADPNNIKAFDETKKYLTDFVNQNGNLSTNDKMAAAFAGNPSVEISNASATDVAKTALALQRMKQAQILAFGEQRDQSGAPLTGDKYAEFAKNFAASQDPRAYGIDMMSPAAKQELDKEMPVGSEARRRFNESLKTALATGMISR